MPTPKKPPGPPGRTSPKLLFTWEDWLPYMDEFDGTDAEKRAFIETLWVIVKVFVDLGWEVESPNDRPEETSGQVFDLTAELRSAVLDLKGQKQKEKEVA